MMRFLRNRFGTPADALLSLSALIAIILFAYHFMVVAHYAVDVPWADDWAVYYPGDKRELPQPFNFAWLFSAHGPHIIVTTRVMTYFLYLTTNLDFAVYQILNFIIFGFLCWLAYFLLGRLDVFGKVGRAAICVAVFFTLDSKLWELHGWIGTGSNMHFVFIFALLALLVLYLNEWPAPVRMFLGGLCLALSMLSSGWGFGWAVGLLGFLLIAYLISLAGVSDTALCRQELMRNLPMFLLLIAVGVWLQLMSKEPTPELAFPWQAGYWDFALNVTANAFGFDTYSRMSWLLGLACLVICLVPVFGMCFGLRDRKDFITALVIAAPIVSGLLATALTAIGRGNPEIFAPTSSKSVHYAAPLAVAMPFVVAGWLYFLRRWRIAQIGSVAALLVALLIGHWDGLRFASRYAPVSYSKQVALRCYKDYVAGIAEQANFDPNPNRYNWSKPALCNDLRFNMAPVLRNAWNKRVSFGTKTVIRPWQPPR
ncbi:hypothetical protein [Ferrovibrio sp.]|uniref:hypothetical protein n=1 Tax=Ferrovibrio sp. TaxID=1917215 RepID=UPI003D0BBD0A